MASPNNTVVNAGSGGSITDSLGNVWTITFANQIAINGTVDPVTNNVLQLAYVNGVVWQYTGYGLWYSYSNADGSWTESATSPLPAAPPPSSTPSPNNTVVNAGSGGSITDSTGNVWTITPSGQIAVNGAVDPVTNNVLQLAYVSNVVWQYTGYDIWYSYSATDGTWTESATSPLPVGTPPTAPTLTAGIATSEQRASDMDERRRRGNLSSPVQAAFGDDLVDIHRRDRLTQRDSYRAGGIHVLRLLGRRHQHGWRCRLQPDHRHHGIAPLRSSSHPRHRPASRPPMSGARRSICPGQPRPARPRSPISRATRATSPTRSPRTMRWQLRAPDRSPILTARPGP
jgi:hypothetical protein